METGWKTLENWHTYLQQTQPIKTVPQELNVPYCFYMWSHKASNQ